MTIDDTFDTYQAWYNENVLPLAGERQDNRVIDLLEVKLAEETDPEFRSFLYSDLVGFLTAAKQHAACLRWAKQCASEFPRDPIAWSRLASCHYYALHQPDEIPTSNDIEKALKYWRRALEVAREERMWLRETSFSFCRALTEWQRWPELESVMHGILKTVEEPCEHDTRDLQDHWLRKVPNGAIRGRLRRQYQMAVDRRRLSVIIEFNAQARNADGTMMPFGFRVWGPGEDPEGGNFCTIHCPLLQNEPFRIYGVDESQACELAISFIRNRVRDEGYEIVDELGSVTAIPDIHLPPDARARE